MLVAVRWVCIQIATDLQAFMNVVKHGGGLAERGGKIRIDWFQYEIPQAVRRWQIGNSSKEQMRKRKGGQELLEKSTRGVECNGTTHRIRSQAVCSFFVSCDVNSTNRLLH